MALNAANDLLARDTDQIQLKPTIEAGIECCRHGRWDEGLRILWKAWRRAGEGEELPAGFYAYTGFGIARFQRRLAEGERMCRHALRLDPSEPRHYLFLAEVLTLRRERKAAVETLLKGLRIDPRNPELRRFQRHIGFRRQPVLSFLRRDHPINVFFGRRRHRRVSRLKR